MSKQRYLVLHDYGMGGLWWWVHARSAREILERIVEVEIVDAPAEVERAREWQLEEVDIDATSMPADLDGLRAKRDAQRGLPGFGLMAGRQVLYLRQEWDGDDAATYLTEIGPNGRRIRQVEVAEDGTAIKTDQEDWPVNPPLVDLYDPQLANQEIGRDEFERGWASARWAHDRRPPTQP